MNLKCPLCLEPLVEAQSLVRFCSDHPELDEQFPCSKENLREKIYCPAQNCRVNGAIKFPGVFLRHLGCVATNPFFGPKGARMPPGPDGSSESSYHAPDGSDHPFAHWEIGMLRFNPTKPEMWFPVMLLRSAMERRDGKRMGVLVELAGAPEAGKTTLAMQAMDEQGYVPHHNSNRIVELSEFIYSRPHRDIPPAYSPFMGALCLRARHRDNHDHLIRLNPTERGTGDLKTVFIRPATKQPRRPHWTRDRSRNWRQWARYHLAEPLWDIVRDGPGTWGEPNRGETWYSVTFYDTAGEEHQSGDFSLQSIEAGVDKVAVVIKATDLFPGSKGESFKVARNRLPELIHKGAENCCLVVTCMDQIFPRLTEDTRQEIKQMADEFADYDRHRERSRQYLIHWMNRLTQKLDTNKSELRRYLEQNPIPVFFVWTEGLEHRGKDGHQPISHGLAQFVCWCLDIDWERINQKAVR